MTSNHSPPRPPVDHYNNPYYLHNSDHAGLVLVSDRLETGADFHAWRRSVRMALNVRNKLGFIDGTIPKPPADHRDSPEAHRRRLRTAGRPSASPVARSHADRAAGQCGNLAL